MQRMEESIVQAGKAVRVAREQTEEILGRTSEALNEASMALEATESSLLETNKLVSGLSEATEAHRHDLQRMAEATNIVVIRTLDHVRRYIDEGGPTDNEEDE